FLSKIVKPVKETHQWAKGTIQDGLNQYWLTVARSAQGQNDVAEFAISLRDFDIGLCGNKFKIGAYHQCILGFGTGYGWPEQQDFWVHPDLWQLATLQDAPC